MKQMAWMWMVAAALAACGGGGDTGTAVADTSSTAAAVTGTQAADAQAAGAAASAAADAGTGATAGVSDAGSSGTATDEAVAAGSGADASRFVPGTYVGHWLTYNYGFNSGVTTFNAGGSLLKFSNENYGKLKGVGAFDVVGHDENPEANGSRRLGLGLAGDLYSDNNVYALGISHHLFNDMVSGTYDPAKKRLALSAVSNAGTSHYNDLCKYCAGVYFLPANGRVAAFYSPVGTASPAGFKLTWSAGRLSWPAAAGVEHWMVSVFDENESVPLERDSNVLATLPFPSTALATDLPPAGYHYTQFAAQMMRPAATRSVALPALVKGRRYVGVISGFGPLWMLQGSNEAAAYASVRWTAN